MTPRFSIDKAAVGAMMGVQNYVDHTPLKQSYKELMKIRASQINGCAYCIEMHTEHARKLGETESRIYALSAWRESPLFSDEERALLAMTEEITFISRKGLSEKTYKQLQQFFDKETITYALMQLAIINAWNRIAVASHTVHPNNISVKESAVKHG